MNSRFNKKVLSAAIALSMGGFVGGLLSGCGSNSSESTLPSGTIVSVAPSLGKFSTGAKVQLKDANGTLIKEGAIGANGKAFIDIGSYTGIMQVEVQGGAGVTYFDEGTNTNKDFPAGNTLKAVSPNVTAEIGVTPLTHAVVENLLGQTLTVDLVNKENKQIADQFGLVNILTAPVLLGLGDKVGSADGDAGKYALLLAGFATAAQSSGFSLVDAVKALALDLKDGDLDGKNGATNVPNAISADAIKTRTQEAVAGFAEESAKSSYSSQLAALDIKVDTPIIPVGPVLSDLAQAKKLFTDLRAGILPYANDNKTGFLDGEGIKLQDEVQALTGNTVDGLEVAVKLAGVALNYLEGTSNCSVLTSSTVSCYLPVGPSGSPVTLSNDTAAKKITYSFSGTSLTGTIDYTKADTVVSSLTMNGKIYGMTQSTQSTIENLAVTRESLANDMKRYTLSGKMTDKNTSGVAVLALEFANGTQINVHEPANGQDDISKHAANITGIFTTANYSFKGQFQINNMVEKEGTEEYCDYYHHSSSSCNSWTEPEMVGGSAAFTGTISGIGLTGVDSNTSNNFDMLAGKLEINADATNYDPNYSHSATNYQTGDMTFTGTTYLSATDPGLKLVLTMAATGSDKGTVTVNYHDFNKGISITGSTNFDKSSSTPQTFTLTDANGIKIVFTKDSASVQVKKGETKLADIAGAMVTYTDGVTNSLY